MPKDSTKSQKSVSELSVMYMEEKAMIYGYASYVLSFIKNTQLIKAR